ncbi:MAG: alpha-glucosidase C-terminal domain-containing protein, partial [Bacteroidales bacterium]|nr:alpha-glucosidase C-terminal domain-containing protein [Bacteroidales bacterium]
QYMIESLIFWLEEADIDGYRFDVAHMVPVDFWDEVRVALDKVKEVFLLAEADQPWLHKKAMNMSYDWRFHHIMNEVAAGKQTVLDMKKHFAYADTAYPPNSILMQFTSNHDENSWNGTAYDRLGNGVKAFAVLTFTVPGMPLIYNGQEACMEKMLKFFERDPIEWKECEMFGFYQKLIQLRSETPALWSADAGGDMEIFSTGMDDKVFVFSRTKGKNMVVSVFNFSQETLLVKLPDDLEGKKLTEYFSGESIEKLAGLELEMDPWDYRVFVKK